MQDHILEKIISTYMATPQPVYSFGWQGGEPTLMGTDFFRKVINLQIRHGRKGARVVNGLQTNATRINEDLAKHLARYKFLVGCSLDGPPEIHDRYRLSRRRQPTQQTVVNGMATLLRHNVAFNVLVVVSQANVNAAREVYRYLKSIGCFYQQYIPCVEFNESGDLQPYAINGPEWGQFLCNIFDEWYPEDIHHVSIRHFDAIMQKIKTGNTGMCTLGDQCSQYFVVEYNGDIYPCDFFVQESLNLGNVMDMEWEAVQSSEVYRKFGNAKNCRHQNCGDCKWIDMCMGDCLKYRAYAGHPPQNLSRLCEGWKLFNHHSHSRFQKIAAIY